MSEKEYTYRVFWSEEDSSFIGTVAEFPSLSYIGDTQEEVFSGIIALVKDVLDDYLEQNDVPPIPFGKKRFSGKMLFRVTPEQHRRIAMEAAEEGVSINRLLAARI